MCAKTEDPIGSSSFAARMSVEQVEEGLLLAPRSDDDQDAVWLCVRIPGLGSSCHVGYRSCFYRAVDLGNSTDTPTQLTYSEQEKVFDPKTVYGDMPNPTQL